MKDLALPHAEFRSKSNPRLLPIAMGLVTLILVFKWTTPYMAAATLAYLLLVYGLFARRERATHRLLMTAGIALDFSLVLVLEFQRSAVQTALEFKLTTFQQGHIFFSLGAAALYFPVLYLGYSLYAHPLQRSSKRKWHLRTAMTAFAFRTLGFLLMFSMLSHVRK